LPILSIVGGAEKENIKLHWLGNFTEKETEGRGDINDKQHLFTNGISQDK
jgi:hypothetical protein